MQGVGFNSILCAHFQGLSLISARTVPVRPNQTIIEGFVLENSHTGLCWCLPKLNKASLFLLRTILPAVVNDLRRAPRPNPDPNLNLNGLSRFGFVFFYLGTQFAGGLVCLLLLSKFQFFFIAIGTVSGVRFLPSSYMIDLLRIDDSSMDCNQKTNRKPLLQTYIKLENVKTGEISPSINFVCLLLHP